MARQQLALLSLVAIAAILAIVGSMRDASAAGMIEGGFQIGEVLDESIGWFIVVGLGAVFAVVISLEIKIEEKYLGVTKTSEWFNTAGRVIKTGLTAAAIVSAWTRAATLLQSSTVAYQYGVSGPFWYAAGLISYIPIEIAGIGALIVGISFMAVGLNESITPPMTIDNDMVQSNVSPAESHDKSKATGAA